MSSVIAGQKGLKVKEENPEELRYREKERIKGRPLSQRCFPVQHFQYVHL